jgi:hypothetical protein
MSKTTSTGYESNEYKTENRYFVMFEMKTDENSTWKRYWFEYSEKRFEKAIETYNNCKKDTKHYRYVHIAMEIEIMDTSPEAIQKAIDEENLKCFRTLTGANK